ncbi:MAG TPA: nicotinate-nucleotide diphosphorylase (carboxylating), partial [Polyangia bacterium]
MLDALLNTYAVRLLIDLALEEDLGRGDVTTQAVIQSNERATAHLVAREPMVLAGLAICTAVFQRVDASISATQLAKDGDRLSAGARAATYSGSAASLLAAERTALNFVQRL